MTCEECPAYEIRHPNYKFGCMRQQCNNERSYFGPRDQCYNCLNCPVGRIPIEFDISTTDGSMIPHEPAIENQEVEQECEYTKKECSCTQKLVGDARLGYDCEECPKDFKASPDGD